jgi:hypothetical protein
MYIIDSEKLRMYADAAHVKPALVILESVFNNNFCIKFETEVSLQIENNIHTYVAKLYNLWCSVIDSYTEEGSHNIESKIVELPIL